MKQLTLMLLAAAALAVSACGGKTLDTANVEKDLQQVSGQGGVQTKAECPDEVEDIKEGTTYECEITYGGNEGNKQTAEMKVGSNDESEFADQKKAEDEVALRQIIASTDEDPSTTCDYLSEEIATQLAEEAGAEDCETAATEGDDGKPTQIKSIEIEGDTATMVTDQSTTTFERDAEAGWIATAIE